VAVFGGTCAGPDRMIGAPALAARGALRAGAGVARVYAPAPILESVIALCPSATGFALSTDENGDITPTGAAQALDLAADTCRGLVIGPGIGAGDGVRALVLRAVQRDDVPVVIDADGLNALAEIPDLFRDFRARAVLTPHPGEFRRLAQTFRIGLDPADAAQRPEAASALAQRLGCIVVLKGAGTVVSNGLESWVCARGHPCMATAGSGDVLAGMIGALAAAYAHRESAPLRLFDVARLAVEAHALAGERWANTTGASGGMLAAELADAVPTAIESLRG